MKILICVDRLTGGGAQRVAALWINGWCQQGHEVSVVLSNERAPRTYIIPDKTKFYGIDWDLSNGYIRHALKILFSKYRLSKIMRQVQPNVIITVGTGWSELVFDSRRKAGINVPIICTDHNSYERPKSAPMTKKEEYLKYEYSKRFEQITVITQADVDYIGNRLCNVVHLPNPLAFEPVSDIPTKKKTILAVGRLDAGHYKGFDILIKAFSLSYMDEWTLQIAGGGSKQSLLKYKKLAERYNVADKVQFLGFVEDPILLYRESSIFVLSSRYEGFGMVLIEAMSQGCASIACDYKGRQKEIITSESEGLLCPTEDYESLAKCMKKMMTDDVYRIKVQNNAPKRASYYKLDNIMERWNNIFRKHNLI